MSSLLSVAGVVELDKPVIRQLLSEGKNRNKL